MAQTLLLIKLVNSYREGKKMKKVLVFLLVPLFCLGLSLPSANATAYTDEAAWRAALGMTPETENFNSYIPQAIPFQSGLDLGDFSLWEIGTTNLSDDWNAITGTDWNGLQVDGTQYVRGIARNAPVNSLTPYGTTLLDVRLDYGIYAWAAYFDNRDGYVLNLLIEFRNYGDPSSVLVAAEPYTTGAEPERPFFGVILDESFQIVRLTADGMGGSTFISSTGMYGMDNMSWAAVPEPTTVLLLGTGLVCLALFGRKRFFKK